MKHAFPTFVLLKIPQMCTWVLFEDIENGRQSLHILWGLQYLKGRKCDFRYNMKLIQCCIETNSRGREFSMAQFICKPSLKIRQDFLNHFMSL